MEESINTINTQKQYSNSYFNGSSTASSNSALRRLGTNVS